MRLTPALLVGLVALATVSAHAAPNQANWVDLGATPPLVWLPKAADIIGSVPVRGITGVIDIGATASPIDVTTMVRMQYGMRPKAGRPYRISCAGALGTQSQKTDALNLFSTVRIFASSPQ
jgi:hypothetical protein